MWMKLRQHTKARQWWGWGWVWMRRRRTSAYTKQHAQNEGEQKKFGCNELFEPPKDKLRVYTATILGPPKAKNPVIQTVEFWFKKIWCPPLPEKENVPKARKTQVSTEVLPTSINTTLPGRGLRPSHTRSKSTFNVIDMKYKILSGTFNRLTVRVHHQNNISDLVEMQTDFLAKEYI